MNMKKIFFVFVIFAISACSKTDKVKSEIEDGNLNQTEQQDSSSIIEILPNIGETDFGHIAMGENGQSIGEKTELTTFLEMLNTDSLDVIVVRWTWDCGAPYNNQIPMRISYYKKEKTLNYVSVQSGLTDKYENVTPECLIKFLKAGKKDFSYLSQFCGDVEYSSNQ
jgi:hypothetical protein